MFKKLFSTLFQQNKDETAAAPHAALPAVEPIDRPLVVVDMGTTLYVPHFKIINGPLYEQLVAFKTNGADIILASDGKAETVQNFLHEMDHQQLDSSLFSAVLTPDTNDGLRKTDGRFWPQALQRFQRAAHQVVMIDDDSEILGRAAEHGIKTNLITELPSSAQSMDTLRATYQALTS